MKNFYKVLSGLYSRRRFMKGAVATSGAIVSAGTLPLGHSSYGQEQDLSGKAVATTVFAVNCGGDSYTSSDGTNYAADTGYSGGSTYSNTASISGTADDALYNSERYGNSTYNVAVPNGLYLVSLYFAETFHTAAGSRSFDVLIQGTGYISDLDIYAEIGGNAAYVVETLVTVSDGELNIAFITNIENAKINAIKVALVGLGAAFNYTPVTPIAEEVMTFDASASTNPDGTITAYSWDFGDGTSSTGKVRTHTYSTAGNYLYTGDLEYLEAVYPVLKSACEFYQDFLIEEPTHRWLVVSPSISPEQGPPGRPPICAGTTMDNQLLFDLFSKTIKAECRQRLDGRISKPTRSHATDADRPLRSIAGVDGGSR